jgi:hypothetical protein
MKYYDKALHFAAGVVIVLILMMAGVSPVYAGVACLVAAAGKEALDEKAYGGASLMDFIATLAGGALVIGVSYFSLVG